MAIAYRSVANSGFITGTSFACPKPTGLAVGDMMIAMGFNAFNAPAGWTSLQSTIVNSSFAQTVWAKLADSSDVAATNFTFTASSTINGFIAIVAISGASNLASLIVSAKGNVNSTNNPSLAGITPNNRGGNLLLQLWCAEVSVTSISNYAIATSNPTWTELLDMTFGINDFSIAYAIRPETTATGNFSCSGSGGSTNWIGTIVAIPPFWLTNASDSVTTADSKNMALSTVAHESVTLTEISDVDRTNEWDTQDKSSSGTWNNQNKS